MGGIQRALRAHNRIDEKRNIYERKNFDNFQTIIIEQKDTR